MTAPRTGAPPEAQPRPALDIDEQTRLGEVYVRSLIRAQLRLSLVVCAGLLLLLGGLPLVLAAFPMLQRVRLAGLPLPWLMLGVATYPVLMTAGWLYVRQAERIERDFTDLVERR